MMNKRGDILDIPIWMIVVVILAIGLFIMVYATTEIMDGMKVAGLNESTEGSNAINTIENFGLKGIQKGFLFLFVGLIIATMISSFFSNTHPVWLFLYIIFLLITVFVATFMGNMYEVFSNVSAFSDILASQSLFTTVMNNIVLITSVVGVLSLIIVFSRFTTGGQKI